MAFYSESLKKLDSIITTVGGACIKRDSNEIVPARHTTSDLLAFLTKLGIKHDTVSHPPVYTVKEAQQMVPPRPGGHCKNLFLQDKRSRTNRPKFLLVAIEDSVVQLKTLGKSLGCKKLHFASRESLMKHLNCTPGAVSPFFLMNDLAHSVKVVLDKRLFTFSHLSFHPLTNAKTTTIRSEDFKTFLRGLGIEFVEVELGAPTFA